MINYDWEKIQKHCKYDPERILWYMAFKSGIYMRKVLYINNRVPKLFWEEAKYSPIPFGESYLLNPVPLFENKEGASSKDIYDYICLASARLLFDYRVRGDYTLHYAVAKAMDIDILNNRLLTVENTSINFKHETEKTED